MPWWSVVELLGTNLATLQDFMQKQWNYVKLGSSCASSITNLCSRPLAYRPWMFVKVAQKNKKDFVSATGLDQKWSSFCSDDWLSLVHMGRTILRLDEQPLGSLARDQASQSFLEGTALIHQFRSDLRLCINGAATWIYTWSLVWRNVIIYTH